MLRHYQSAFRISPSNTVWSFRSARPLSSHVARMSAATCGSYGRRGRAGISLPNYTASENTAPVPFESAYAIWTSWQHSCDRDDQALMQRGDRVGNVTLGPDRRRRGVGNYREWQVF